MKNTMHYYDGSDEKYQQSKNRADAINSAEKYYDQNRNDLPASIHTPWADSPASFPSSGKPHKYNNTFVNIMPVLICILLAASLITVIVCVVIAEPSKSTGSDEGIVHGGGFGGPGSDIINPETWEPSAPEIEPDPAYNNQEFPPDNYAPVIIDCSLARKHIGENVTVYGKITNVQYGSGNGEPTYIFFGADYPGKDCVIATVWCELPEWMDFSRGCKLSVSGDLRQNKDGDVVIEVDHPASFFE